MSLDISLKCTYGLWNNLEVYAVIPYIHNWAGNVREPVPRGGARTTSRTNSPWPWECKSTWREKTPPPTSPPYCPWSMHFSRFFRRHRG